MSHNELDELDELYRRVDTAKKTTTELLNLTITMLLDTKRRSQIHQATSTEAKNVTQLALIIERLHKELNYEHQNEKCVGEQ